MSKPKHQHFIPKSYIKNFAQQVDDKFFVEAKLKDEEKPKRQLISIRDICVDKNIYTLPNIEGNEKYSLEKYYATNIDGVYPSIYKQLVDPDCKEVSPRERKKIIMTIMSLYYRTPKFLNAKNEFNKEKLDIAISNYQDKDGFVNCEILGKKYNFHISKYEQIMTDIKIRNKTNFIINHLKDWHEFVTKNYNAGIVVYKIYEDIELISSDNPVVIRNLKTDDINLFDNQNIIMIPLDNNHFLKIFPNNENEYTNNIFREERDKWFALTTNHSMENNCEEWIYGKPNTITRHINDQYKYNQPTEENKEAILTSEYKAKCMKEVFELVHRNGSFHSSVAEKS